MLKAIIVDDEAHQRENLRIILENHCENVSVIGEAENALKAAVVIGKQKADIIFLDIQMPDQTGLDLLELLGRIEAKIILVTAHDNYMQKAFKLNVFDYIIKPIDIDEVKETLKRIEELSDSFEILKSNTTRLSLPTSNGMKFIDFDLITYIQAEGSYSIILLKTGEKVVVSKNLKYLESKLDDRNFFRVHRSYIVNLNFIDEFIKSDGGYLNLVGNIEIPISSDRKDDLLENLSK